MEDDTNAEFFIPLIWQGDGSSPSPGYSARGSMYGVGGIPHSQWNGWDDIVGGGGSSMYNAYLSEYNMLVSDEAPLELQVGLGFDNNGDLLVQANAEITEELTSTNNKIVYIVKRYQDNDYFCSVVHYAHEDFDLTSVGQTGSYSYSFPMDETWDIENLMAVAMVQTFSGNTEIFQAGQAQLTGLVASIGSNVQSGPPSLAVNFSSLSYPLSGIESWEWDIDGDGVYDYFEENPSHVYTEPGSYDVSLRIGMEGEFDEVTIEDYITVTEDPLVEPGPLSGTWHADFGPYIIIGDVIVQSGDELVIEAGTTINVESEGEFKIKGKLVAQGTPEDMIIINSSAGWNGFHFEDTQEMNSITWCDISGSTESALYVENSNCEIMHNIIHHNTGTQYGAAIELLDVADITISENMIANNTSTGLTGGISMLNSYPYINNNIIVNNSGSTAGAFSIKQDSAPSIVNNTIANNTAINGTFLLFNSYPTIVNCIIISDDNVFAQISSSPTVIYTCLTGGFEGDGNIDEDPMFNAPSAGSGSEYDGLSADWSLADGSPCIDAGNPNPVYNDLDGSINDMGAYGWNGFTDFEFTSSEPDVIIPPAAAVKAFPNPFNPLTTISFTLNEDARVSLDVFNVKGEKMETIASGYKSAGEHQIIWNAESSASGIYFLRLKAGSQESFTRLILLK